MNPFSTTYSHDTPDDILVHEVLEGKKKSLNELILRHQPFIYNIAWKMIGDPIKAEDLTQEALLKIISNLSYFEGKSSLFNQQEFSTFKKNARNRCQPLR